MTLSNINPISYFYVHVIQIMQGCRFGQVDREPAPSPRLYFRRRPHRNKGDMRFKMPGPGSITTARLFRS